ncbi:MAG: VWA domain-containing protein, partial [Planctomycetaceae bacterium]
MNALPLLNPSLLYFLPIAAIPVILHLFTLFRVKTVDLSTYRFLFDSYVQQRRKTKFVEALIALLRTLFLLLLVGMLARPAIQHWDRLFGSGGSGRDVVLLVDTSVSMNTTAAGKSALDRAKGVAREIADRLGPEDRLTLFRLGSRPEEVFSRFAGDTQAIHERIDSLKAGSSRANMLAAFTQVFGPQAPPRDKPVVYLLSDGQATGWRELQSQALPRLLPEGSQLHVVQCGSNAPLSNRGIVGDAPRQVRATVGLPLKLRPRVVNHSDTESADLLVSVQLDDREIARPGLLLKPGETASAEVIHTPTEPGVYEGRFVLERPDAGLEDGFPDDDTWLFTLVV